MTPPHVHVPVGAHYGWRDWLVQRVTALFMLAYTVLVIGLVLWHGGFDYESWKAMFASGAFRVLSFLFMTALIWHAWIGMRNILMDYVKPTGIRLTLECVVAGVLVAYLGWTIGILWGGG